MVLVLPLGATADGDSQGDQPAKGTHGHKTAGGGVDVERLPVAAQIRKPINVPRTVRPAPQFHGRYGS